MNQIVLTQKEERFVIRERAKKDFKPIGGKLSLGVAGAFFLLGIGGIAGNLMSPEEPPLLPSSLFVVSLFVILSTFYFWLNFLKMEIYASRKVKEWSQSHSIK